PPAPAVSAPPAPAVSAPPAPAVSAPPVPEASAVPHVVTETPSGIAADADRQLSKAFIDDDDLPLDPSVTPREPAQSASESQLSSVAPADDGSLNAMVTAAFGEGGDEEDEDEDFEEASEPHDEVDEVVARAPSVSVILGREPEPRPQSYTQQVRLEEEQLYQDLEDDLLEEFEPSNTGKKVVLATLLLGAAAVVATFFIPGLNAQVRGATGVEVPLLLALDSSEPADATQEAAVSATSTTGESAATGDGTTGGLGDTTGGDPTSSTGGTGGETTGGAEKEKKPAAPPAEASKKKASTKSSGSKSKKKTTTSSRASSGGSGSLVDRGCRYVNSGNLSKGISTLRKAFDRNPRDLDVLTCLGDAYRKKGNSRQARHYYDMALRINKRYRPAIRGKEKL
ncbi:MAG: hypothetical protein ACPHRO_08420, partial [Nannocystaceae bacterium]